MFSLAKLCKSHNSQTFGQYFLFLLMSYVVGTRLLEAIIMIKLMLKLISATAHYSFNNIMSLFCRKCSKFDLHLISPTL